VCRDSTRHASHVTHMNTETLIMCVKSLIHRYYMNHTNVCRDSIRHVHDALMCATHITHLQRDNRFVCDMTHSYILHDSLIYVPWLNASHTRCLDMCDTHHTFTTRQPLSAWYTVCCMCGVLDSYVCRDSLFLCARLCLAWLICVRAVTHSVCVPDY